MPTRPIRAWLLAALLAVLSPLAGAHTIELTEQELLERVAPYFPQTQESPYASVRLSDPAISLSEKSNRIGLHLTVEASALGNPIGKGRCHIDGTPDYRPETGEIYLRDPKLLSLELEGLPEQYAAAVKSLVDAAAQASLPVILIYKLGNTTREKFARSMLRSVKVENGKLLLEFDML